MCSSLVIVQRPLIRPGGCNLPAPQTQSKSRAAGRMANDALLVLKASVNQAGRAHILRQQLDGGERGGKEEVGQLYCSVLYWGGSGNSSLVMTSTTRQVV